MNDPEALASMRAANRQMLVFLAAVVAALLLAVLLPDLVPSTARRNIGDVFHARVVAIVQADASSSESSAPSGPASGSGGPSDQGPGGIGSGALLQARVEFSGRRCPLSS